MNNIDHEVWDKDYKDIFFGDPEKFMKRQIDKTKIAPAKKGEQASLNIKRKDVKPVQDISDLLGRAPGAGKNDPNKKAIKEISVAKKKPNLVIKPSDDGGLSVYNNDGEG